MRVNLYQSMSSYKSQTHRLHSYTIYHVVSYYHISMYLYLYLYLYLCIYIYMVTPPPRSDLQTCLHTEEMFQGGWPFIYKTQKPKNPKWHRPWDDLWGAYQDRHGLCHFGFWGKTQKPKNPKLHTTKKNLRSFGKGL